MQTYRSMSIGSSLTFSAQGGRGKEKSANAVAKISVRQSEGEAEGGGVGRPEAEQARYGVKIPPRPSRSKAPPPCSFRAEPSKKVFFSF